MNLGSKGMSGRLLQYLTRQTTPDLETTVAQNPAPLLPSCPSTPPGVGGGVLQEGLTHLSGKVR